jgi:hypothetical protein
VRVREQLQRRYGNEGLGGRSLLGIAGYPNQSHSCDASSTNSLRV